MPNVMITLKFSVCFELLDKTVESTRFQIDVL